jgi:hypothetical protein
LSWVQTPAILLTCRHHQDFCVEGGFERLWLISLSWVKKPCFRSNFRARGGRIISARA